MSQVSSVSMIVLDGVAARAMSNSPTRWRLDLPAPGHFDESGSRMGAG